MSTNTEKTKYNKLIIAVSIIIPIAVALLFGVNLQKMGFDVKPLSFLPPIYATINGLTAVLLILAVVSIKNGKRTMHERLMKGAIFCSLLFLLMYISYHITSDSTVYEGNYGFIYYPLLISHIILSIIIIPLVLFTYVRALAKQFDQHKKLAKITFPIWLYVAVTGVVVYLMIAPYYAN
ncbi:DUF420 domain-containing protein [uncultured Flavobacterium sp.]|uniref:DUF420 domain-containing protein n=1 Tax=uncultured Flavobacterium sp. TaxID=165435 RepID=UPI0030CA32E4|tara:strand:+ start:830 stop:1366 length:537 start_codon:yes stop_codon:yes gene_type:complete